MQDDDAPNLFAHIISSHSGKTQAVPQWHIPSISHHPHITHWENALHIHRKNKQTKKHSLTILIPPRHPTFHRWHHFCHVYAWFNCVQGRGGGCRVIYASTGPKLGSSWAESHSHTLPLHPLSVSANFSLECPSVHGILGCTVLITGRCRGFYTTAVVIQ